MFDIHQHVSDPDSGELHEERMEAYIDDLMDEFAKSPEAQPFLEERGHLSWAGWFMEYFFGYIGDSLPEVTLRDFEEVVFELFPRKISTDPESAEECIAELKAFWSFLDRQYHLPNARKIVTTLTDQATARLRERLASPSNWGMAKSFFMMGQQAGFDMTDQRDAERFLALYNLGRLQNMPMPPDLDEFIDDGFMPSLPPSPLSPKEKAKKRKERKAQRQARKRNRRR